MVAVKPEVLKWARETAGLELAEAAKKLGFADSGRSSASEKLAKLESGKPPTQAQIERMSRVYHQPLIVFYLSQPPSRGDLGDDFRTIPQRRVDKKGDAHLGLLMRNIKASQNLVRQLREDDSNVEPLPFIASATLSMGIERVAQDIVAQLDFDLDTFREQKTVRHAFTYLRQQIERAGIFVLLMSDLGSHHTTIPVEVFRGFAFADSYAPYIVINRQDAVSAWSFTALHEVTHLWLGNSGVSGAWGEQATERFCNRVAAAVLLPSQELENMPALDTAPFQEAADKIDAFAATRNISATMVAYNLRLGGNIGQARWQELHAHFREKWRESRTAEKSRQANADGGPTYYVVRRSYLGKALLGLARQYVGMRKLTPSKASVVLGISAANVYRLLYPERYRG